MSEETKFRVKIYSSSSVGTVSRGFHRSSMEIIEVTAGEVAVQIGTENFTAREGEFILVPRGLVLHAEAVGGSASVRAIVFDSSLIEENMDNFDTEIFYMFYVQSRNKITVFNSSHPIYETLVYSMGECYDEYVARDVCYKLPIRANVYIMITALLRYYCGSKNELDRMIYHNVMRLRPVINYIDGHYGEKIYIETLSDMITVSPDYFTKMFKDSIGKTPVDYINGIRINHALELLSETDVPVNEIAEKIGFSNSNYFHKIFKQYMNTSPLSYRKSAKLYKG